jgi:hypothetical protein
MNRALTALFFCAAPTLAQPPGLPRPTDGIVLTRDQHRALLARVDEAYRNLPDDLTFVNDEPRVVPTVRATNGVWVVVEMTLDGRRLPLGEFDGLSYEFEDGAFRYLDSPGLRTLPPGALIEWRTPEATAVYTAVSDAVLEDRPGQMRDVEAIRPRLLHIGEGRAGIWWWDRYGESLDPGALYRDPDTLTSIPELQRAIPAEGSLVVTSTQLTLRVRGVGLRALLPPKYQAPLGNDRAVVLVMERSRRRPYSPRIPLTIPPELRPVRLAANDRPATETAIVRHTLLPEPRRLVFDTMPSTRPTRIVLLPEASTPVQVVRSK